MDVFKDPVFQVQESTMELEEVDFWKENIQVLIDHYTLLFTSIP